MNRPGKIILVDRFPPLRTHLLLLLADLSEDDWARPLYDPYFLSPVLDTFVRALTHAYRNTTSPSGTVVQFKISEDAGGVWYLYKTEDAWILLLDSPVEPVTTVVLPQDVEIVDRTTVSFSPPIGQVCL